jgi:hypothetical protein
MAMSVPLKKPYPAPRSLIVLGKITNQEEENQQGIGHVDHAGSEAWRAGCA